MQSRNPFRHLSRNTVAPTPEGTDYFPCSFCERSTSTFFIGRRETIFLCRGCVLDKIAPLMANAIASALPDADALQLMRAIQETLDKLSGAVWRATIPILERRREPE